MRTIPLVPSLSWPNPFTLVLAALAVVIFLGPPADLDYCWQIRTGEIILRTGEIPRTDSFSYTIAGRRVPDHEWLYEAGLAIWYRLVGDAGLKWLRVAFFAAPLLVLAWQLKSRAVPQHGIVLTVLAGTLVCISFERLRPMVFSTLGLQLVSGWLSDHVRGRRRLDWRLPLVMLLWGNLHPAVIMGQALLLGAMVWEWWAWYRGHADRSMVSQLSIGCLLGLAASCIAPDPVGRLLYPFSPELRHPAQQLFREIRPPWRYLGEPPYLFEFVGLWAAVVAVVLWLRRHQFRGWEWGLFLGLSGLAATATRGVIDWFVITASYAVPQIGPILRDAVRRRDPSARLLVKVDRLAKHVFSGALLRPQRAWLGLVLAGLGLFAVSPWSRWTPNRENPRWPRGVADAIAAGLLPTPPPWNIFSGSDEGSYLLWRFPGQARVYSDTRGFYYPGEYLMDSFELPAASPDWPERLERVLAQATEYVLLPASSRWWELLEASGAEPLYRDGQYVLLTTEQVRAAVDSWRRTSEFAP